MRHTVAWVDPGAVSLHSRSWDGSSWPDLCSWCVTQSCTQSSSTWASTDQSTLGYRFNSRNHQDYATQPGCLFSCYSCWSTTQSDSLHSPCRTLGFEETLYHLVGNLVLVIMNMKPGLPGPCGDAVSYHCQSESQTTETKQEHMTKSGKFTARGKSRMIVTQRRATDSRGQPSLSATHPSQPVAQTCGGSDRPLRFRDRA